VIVNDFSKSGQKILAFPDKIKNYLDGEADTLIVAELDLTNRCNNYCPFCAGGRANLGSLTYREAESFLIQLRNIGAEAVIFTGGGEPLLHPGIVRIIRFAHDLGLKCGLFSNGLALEESMFQAILECCTFFRISLDGGSPGIYSLTHGLPEKYFWQTINNVQKLVDCHHLNYPTVDCVIGLGYLVGRQTGNIRDLEDFAKLSVSLKVDFAQYRPFHWDNTFYQVIPDLVDIAERLSGAITTINFSSHKIGNDYRHYSVCHGANFATVIGADANVYLCCHLRGQQRYAIGNLRRESLLTVWSRRQSVIEKVKVAGCMPQCRCHAVNQVVQDVVDNRLELVDILPQSHDFFL